MPAIAYCRLQSVHCKLHSKVEPTATMIQQPAQVKSTTATSQFQINIMKQQANSNKKTSNNDPYSSNNDPVATSNGHYKPAMMKCPFSKTILESL
jgi:hypothetical protein